MVWVVAEGMVSRCLQWEGLVETITREVPIIGGSEVKAIWGHTLLRWQVPAAVGASTGRWVFVLLTHAYRITAVEAALVQGAHVLFREVALGVAAPWQQLLALCRGGGEAIRVGRSVEPRQEGGGGRRGREESVRRRGKKEGVISCPNLKQLSNISQPLTPFHCSVLSSSAVIASISILKG